MFLVPKVLGGTYLQSSSITSIGALKAQSTCKGVISIRSCFEMKVIGGAFSMINFKILDGLLKKQADRKGEEPFLSLALNAFSGVFSWINCTTSKGALEHAKWNGVRPSLSFEQYVPGGIF